MNILDKRPLSTILLAVLSSFVFFSQLPNYLRAIFVVCNVTLFILSFIPKMRFPRLLSFVFVFSILSCFLSYLYFDTYFFAEKRYKDPVTVVGTVEEIKYQNENGVYFSMMTDNVNDDLFSRYRFYVEMQDLDATDLQIGDSIKITLTLSSLQDTNAYADGYAALGKCQEPYEFLSCGNLTSNMRLSSLQKRIIDYIKNMSDNEEVGGLLCALLMGDKSSLSKQLSLDFKRIGVSHLLALSGMHLCIISLFLTKLMSIFGLGRKASKIILLIFVPIYIVLTGASPSILRAGIMVLIATIAFLFKTKSDTITTLFLTVFIILLWEPYAVFSASLWLSALATLGIITLPSAVEYRAKSKVFCYIFSSIIFSFSALLLTLPITAYLFGTFSLLSPISTLVMGILTQGYIYLGICNLALGKLLPLSLLLETLYAWIAKTAAFGASVPFATIDVSFTLTKILIFILLLGTFAFLVFKIKKRVPVLLSLIAALFVVGGVGILFSHNVLKKESSYYIKKTSDEYIVATSNEKIILFDFSHENTSTTYEVKTDLEKMHMSEIDTLVISQYSSGLPMALSSYLSGIPIQTIYLPAAQNEEEREILFSIREKIKDFRVKVTFYTTDEHIGFENLAWHPIYVSEYSKDSGSVFVLSRDAQTLYTYFGKGCYFDLKKETAADLTANSVAVIFGCHGYKANSSSIVNLQNDKLKIAIFSDSDIKIDHNCDLSETKIYSKTFPPYIPLYVE